MNKYVITGVKLKKFQSNFEHTVKHLLESVILI